MYDSEQSLGHLVGACAKQLSELSACCEALQSSLSHSLASTGLEAQSLDLITQRAAGLAQFLGALGADLPHEWTIDPSHALKALPLTDLARAIAGHAPLEAEPGEIDFFGD
ncbi:hypothetical protein [Phenylobacterium sp.]|uniref:hypothetical protein n=1 Tax=Phenylobacterium sp. TaxID=1871053 RepID=UPI002FE3B9AD